MSGDTFPGNCLCGPIRFVINAPTKWCAHCHCTMCQQTHGAAIVTWVGVPEDQLTITAGENALRWYASSEDSRRGFCPRCSNSLFFRSERWPGEVHAVRACIDGDIDRRPDSSAHFDTHPGWFPFVEVAEK